MTHFHFLYGLFTQKLLHVLFSKVSLIPFLLFSDTSSLFPTACHKDTEQNRKKRLPDNKMCLWPFPMTEMPSSHHMTGWGRPCISNYASAPDVGKHNVCTEQGFRNLRTINALLYRSVLHIILCLAVALASSHQMPAVPPGVTIQMSPDTAKCAWVRGNHRHPQLRNH